MHLALGLGQPQQVLDHQFLLQLDDGRDVDVVNQGVHVALHEGAPVVVLDIALPVLLGQLVLLAEPLFLEVPDGEVVRVGQQVLHLPLLHFLLILVHKPSAEAADLFLGSDGQEGYFREGLLLVDPVADAPDDLLGAVGVVLADHQRLVLPVEHQLHDVLPGHLRQLSRENVLQVDQHPHVLPLLVVPDGQELDLAV